jgi:trimeric autotransporter adhesin
MNAMTQSKNTTILPVLIALTLGCFGLSPQARAVCQQGCVTSANTFLGDNALFNLTGTDNTALGFFALFYNTTGSFNTANGSQALDRNTGGYLNTASGALAIFNNTVGNNNTANGAFALINNTTGNDNTASGAFALFNNDIGSNNTATGSHALFGPAGNVSRGSNNTATGYQALDSNINGNGNTASGALALFGNTMGDNNTATGNNALSSNSTGSFNIALGAEAGGDLTAGSNNIDIGNRGVAGEASTIRIGTRGRHTNTFIAGISGGTVPTGVAVIVDADGHLGTSTSSARFKDEIKPMDKASEVLLALKPVTFRYKKEIDPASMSQFGLVAEEVEKVNPDLVVRDKEGNPYTVRYDAVNAMLLNEFLKEHRKVEEQGATIIQQRKNFETAIARLQNQIEALTAGLQKVSAQLEARKPAPQVVKNND